MDMVAGYESVELIEGKKMSWKMHCMEPKMGYL